MDPVITTSHRGCPSRTAGKTLKTVLRVGRFFYDAVPTAEIAARFYWWQPAASVQLLNPVTRIRSLVPFRLKASLRILRDSAPVCGRRTRFSTAWA